MLDSYSITKKTMKENYKIGIALGGGSARGYAHIGVLKAIDELQIPIDFISDRKSVV